VSPETPEVPEIRHRACWYSRRTAHIPADIGIFHTIEDGQLLFCGHPMWFPIVGYEFDVRNCGDCDYFKPLRAGRPAQVKSPRL
jgi:hypothetical protein